PNPRNIDRQQTEPPRAGAMLLGRKILEVEARIDFLENEIVYLNPLDFEWLLRRQTCFRRDAIFRPEGEIAFQGYGILLNFRFDFFRNGRHRNPARNRLG